MRWFAAVTVLLFPLTVPAEPLPAEVQARAKKLLEAGLADEAFAWQRLAHLTDTFGSRFSGSDSLEGAIDWILARMQEDGLAKVRGEPVQVPHWIRGTESLEAVAPFRRSLPVLGLGPSISTPPQGLTAPVLVVKSFDDLRAHAAEAKGRIIVWNVPFTSYGETVAYRGKGAIEAARVGAVASLVRSVTPASLRTPHTGAMRYDPDVTQIPAAAITVEDAERLQRLQDRGGEPARLHLTLQETLAPEATSRNVVAELIGSEKPEEVVVIGGHIDSWDVGDGAMDDGGGSIAAWEAVRLIHALGIRPKRTIRVVLWTNEENGLRGGRAYKDAHAAELANHVAAIESDNGVFKPKGFRFAGPATAMAITAAIEPLLRPIEADHIHPGDGEADVGPLIENGVPAFGLEVEGEKYFWYHHTQADTLDKLNPTELSRCVAAMAVLAYTLADMPGRLPQGVAKH